MGDAAAQLWIGTAGLCLRFLWRTRRIASECVCVHLQVWPALFLPSLFIPLNGAGITSVPYTAMFACLLVLLVWAIAPLHEQVLAVQ